MKTLPYFATIIFSTSAIANESEELAFYYQLGYTLEEVADINRPEALETLVSIRKSQRMRGHLESCETIYHLADETGQSVAYGSICKTDQANLKGFFCWDKGGQHFGYANRRHGASSDWMGDSILHGCGGALVPEPDHREKIDGVELVPTRDGWALPEVGWGEKRPVVTMLYHDLKRLGFDISPRCDPIRLISLGEEGNNYYGATCKIDAANHEAVICLDNLAENFGIFTRHQKTSKWTELTMYRFCWSD
ncbi:hypothetical protein [Pseudomonas sp. RIT-PI-S]|uniref:hypothetical protein n=1 Tax=Pseudomonas sp. RIT-PI-S TaxID=3035295 RepID=UPI0021D87313|nr:hypothetical protein [Pseudomonas sp. RIT-PI-S]